MPKRLFPLAFLLFLASGLPFQGAFAGETVVFGPARYERASGKPQRVTTQFAGPASGSGFIMEIRNGDADGSHRVSSGTVVLNGEKVAGPSDFSRNVARIERPVSVRASNQLEVLLKGGPGSFVTVSVMGAEPGLSVSLSASPGEIAAGGSSTLTWSSTGADSCEIDQGVGKVALEGSLTVSPQETTTYTVTARGAEGTATAGATVTVRSPAPVAGDDQASTPQDTPVVLDVLANDTGSGLSVSDVTQGGHGLVSMDPGGTVTYAPEADFNGEDRFTYTVRDSLGGAAKATVTVTVTPVNDPPAAHGQSVIVDQGAAVSILLAGSDPDGDILSFFVTAWPAHGSLAGTPPQITYTPNPDYHGEDGFTFRVNDGSLDSQPAAVSITVNRVNHPPTVVDDAAATNAGRAAVVPVLANDSDPDGDPLHISAFTQGAHGSVVEGGAGSLVYTPTSGFTGEDGFSYTVSDGNGGSASGTVRITVNAQSSIEIAITCPLSNEVIAGRTVMVRGTVTNEAGLETGVAVGGVTALVFGSEFVANAVPLQDGENLLTATAMDAEGNTASASVVVVGDLEGDHLRLHATVYSGVPPVDTSLRVDASFGFTTPVFSCTGPAEVQVLDDSVPEERRVRFPVEGTYECTAMAKDPRGMSYSDTVIISVPGRDAVDTLLRAKWAAMRQALAGGSVDAALRYFSSRSRDRYGMIFGGLSGRLPEIVSRMQDIEMILCRGDMAEYRMNRVHVVNGRPVEITYSVFFARDENGLWKIDKF